MELKFSWGGVKNVREWLKDIRLEMNLTQEEVAKESNISREYYSRIESGTRNIPVKTAKAIANVLNFSWTDFYEK